MQTKSKKGSSIRPVFSAREKIFDIKTLPYTTQLMPLSAICAVLGFRFEEEPIRRKLARWFWCGVFGELYGGANETRFAFDLPDVIRWVEGGDEPRTVRDASFTPIRLLSLQSRLSAAYKGLMAQLMQIGSKDFLSGDPIDLTRYFDLAVDIHHIFPRHHCEKNEIERFRWNSVINKAPLTARTNRMIGGRSPSQYLSSLQKHHEISVEQIGEILNSHLINLNLLQIDNFDGFLVNRASNLLDLIEKATGKSISGRDSEEVIKAFGEPLMAG